MRHHLQAAQRSTGRTPPELVLPPLPVACRGVWELFAEMHAGRGVGMGPEPINETRLLAWQQLHRIRLSPWEIEAIGLVDNAWLNASMPEPASNHRTKQQAAAAP